MDFNLLRSNERALMATFQEIVVFTGLLQLGTIGESERMSDITITI